MALLRIPGRFKFPVTQTEWRALIGAFTGDSGAGGVTGLVPAPSAGDAAAGKFLGAGGTWSVPGGSGSGSPSAPQCRLAKWGSYLVLSPRGGNLLTVNGVNCTVPDAGVSLAPTGLTPGTTYYIYATQSGGAINALEASTTTHATSTTTGNKGTEIKSGDDARTLVGMVRVITGPAFADTAAQRLVSSYFNRQAVAASNTFNSATTSSGSFVALGSVKAEFLVWANDAAFLTAGCRATVNAATNIYTTNFLDSAAAGPTTQCASGTSGTVAPHSANYAAALSEGYHTLGLAGAVDSGTGTFSGAAFAAYFRG